MGEQVVAQTKEPIYVIFRLTGLALQMKKPVVDVVKTFGDVETQGGEKLAKEVSRGTGSVCKKFLAGLSAEQRSNFFLLPLQDLMGSQSEGIAEESVPGQMSPIDAFSRG